MEDFFVSYRQSNHSTAFEIAGFLRPKYTSILYERDMDLKRDAEINIQDALNRSHILLACISSEYTVRRLCQMEYSRAMASRIWIVFVEQLSKPKLEPKPWALATDYWRLKNSEDKRRELLRGARFLRP